MNIVQPGATQATFFVRGVGLSDFSSNAAGAVTIFQDDVALNAPAIQTGQLFDVEGVDVRARSAGQRAVPQRVGRRDPRPLAAPDRQLRRAAAHQPRPLRHARATRARDNALIQDYEGALEMPIVEDSLSSRFAFRLREADPYKTNGCGNALPFAQRLARSQDPAGSDDLRDIRAHRCAASADRVDDPAAAGRSRRSGRPPDGGERRAQLGGARDVALPAARHRDRVLPERARQPARPGLDAGAGDRNARRSADRSRRHRSDSAGSATRRGYVDPDVSEEFDELCGTSGTDARQLR